MKGVHKGDACPANGDSECDEATGQPKPPHDCPHPHDCLQVYHIIYIQLVQYVIYYHLTHTFLSFFCPILYINKYIRAWTTLSVPGHGHKQNKINVYSTYYLGTITLP